MQKARVFAVGRFGMLATLLLATPPPPVHAAFPGENGKIAFSSTRDEPNPDTCGTYGQPACNSEIYTMDADGSGVTRLTDNPAPDQAPAWSPDGKKIAFESTRNDPNLSSCDRFTMSPSCPFQIYVMNADGSGVVRLTDTSSSGSSTSDLHPVWSPDGSKIAISRGTGYNKLVTMNSDGTGQVELTSGPSDARDPAWSPDGGTIALSYDVSPEVIPDPQLYLIDADGSNLRRLMFSPNYEFGPDWSPDGTRIAFDEVDVGPSIVNRDGTGYRQIFPCCSFFGQGPVWSPDGQKLVLQGCVPGNFSGQACLDTAGIYTANPDGSGLTRLTNNASDAGSDWQPLLGPRRSDYKNSAQFCQADRDFLGDEAFRNKYGTNPNAANAFGKCVSAG